MEVEEAPEVLSTSAAAVVGEGVACGHAPLVVLV